MPRRKRAKQPDPDFASYAWLLIGTFRTAAGWLDLAAAQCRAGDYAGGGVKLTAAGVRYRLSFVLPNGGEYPAARATAAAGDLAALSIVWQKASDIGAGHKVGKEWKRRLTEAVPAAPRGPAGPDNPA